MKKKAAKKAMKKSSAKSKAQSKDRSKPKAKKASVKAKSRPAAKSKGKSALKPKTRAKPKASQGLTVVDLFKMKQEREAEAAQGADAWKHKKEIPQQDEHHPEDAKMDNVKRSGFGGTRHH
jgi:hypothetical protein